MTYFGMNLEELTNLSAVHTAREINQQPDTWIKTINQVKEMKDELKSFVDQVLKSEDYDVVFTGAGTSEFVGNTLFAAINLKMILKHVHMPVQILLLILSTIFLKINQLY